MQKDTKSQINTSSNYLKVGKYFLAPAYKYGHIDCDNCKQSHWHDQPCNKADQANSVIPNSKRHSKATRKMIELMNLSRFFRLSQRFKGGKDGKSPFSSERAAITGSSTKPDKPSGRHQSRETQAARAAAASAKLQRRSGSSNAENDLCSEDDSLSSDGDFSYTSAPVRVIQPSPVVSVISVAVHFQPLVLLQRRLLTSQGLTTLVLLSGFCCPNQDDCQARFSLPPLLWSLHLHQVDYAEVQVRVPSFVAFTTPSRVLCHQRRQTIPSRCLCSASGHSACIASHHVVSCLPECSRSLAPS